MILAHTRFAGQLNVPDAFTRLLQSILVTGIAPRSFYETDADGRPQRAHYDGLPVDFVAESIITLAAKPTDEFRSFDVMNPYDDGVSLDTFVDWLIDAGHRSRGSTLRRVAQPIRDRVDRPSGAPAATQRAASAGRVSQAGEADTGCPCTDRGVSRRRSGGQGWRRPRHSPCLGVADRQVRGRPTAPRPRLIGGCSRLPGMPIAARAKLATRLIVLATAGLVVAGLSGCDAKSTSGPSLIPTPDPNTRQVTVVGSGEVQGTTGHVDRERLDRVHRAGRHRCHEPGQCSSAGRDRRPGGRRASTRPTSAPRT